MAVKVFKMTAAGKAKLEEELEFLSTQGRNDIAEKLKVARSYGDLSENSEYDEAKSEQAKIEAKINELKYQLENAVIVETIGIKVTVLRKMDNKEIVYEIVGYGQENASEGKITDESPVGAALVSAHVGETVSVEAPVGTLEFEILNIEK